MLEVEFEVVAILPGCLAGDERAWRQLIDRYSAMVWAIAREYRLTVPDSHDVYQSTWMKVVMHLDQLRAPDRLSAWIATTARRECLKQIERSKRHLPVGDNTELDVMVIDHNTEAPEDAAIRAIDNEGVRAAFVQLPARDQLLLGVLVCDYAPNYDRISEMLGIPRGSIGPLRRRALTRLRQLLPDEFVNRAA